MFHKTRLTWNTTSNGRLKSTIISVTNVKFIYITELTPDCKQKMTSKGNENRDQIQDDFHQTILNQTKPNQRGCLRRGDIFWYLWRKTLIYLRDTTINNVRRHVVVSFKTSEDTTNYKVYLKRSLHFPLFGRPLR